MDTSVVSAPGVTMKDRGVDVPLPGGKSGYFNFLLAQGQLPDVVR
jgi:hypothetical protein